MTQQFWCETCEQVAISGDHECYQEPAPETPLRFLGWLRQTYVERGALTFWQLANGWVQHQGSPVPISLLERALQSLMDTGEVACDTQHYPPVYWPRGMETDRPHTCMQCGLQCRGEAKEVYCAICIDTCLGLQHHTAEAVRLATERRPGKVQL